MNRRQILTLLGIGGAGTGAMATGVVEIEVDLPFTGPSKAKRMKASTELTKKQAKRATTLQQYQYEYQKTTYANQAIEISPDDAMLSNIAVEPAEGTTGDYIVIASEEPDTIADYFESLWELEDSETVVKSTETQNLTFSGGSGTGTAALIGYTTETVHIARGPDVEAAKAVLSELFSAE